ncbi:efflux RND transporter permease subunit [Pseudovibrio sp. Tun.PSC04-5.I4]|uniref:efflux RND transporter permease subunit n=1 Tax=Pseudovibrio sp. Tun.PSC04-5.I4 TaxID=1798213 RepID=UPI00088D5436|nr:efflux RND transporter permease subunit [Pseudovibrio sp. Tun.PSC04-5.I4]SDQ94086.1 multidrug efflux pump [Pseudovibrio sp. Tun.PSC04-5.I4]
MISMLEGVLQRPKTVFILMVFMVIAGIMSYIAIPKEAAPDIDVPVFYVSIGQSGISPEDGARLIGQPMETELRGLEGLKEITTVASEGHVGILLEFDISIDKDKALTDVREKVDTAKAKIPSDANEPSVSSFNMALQPTITIALAGDVPERTLYKISQRLKDSIEAIASVKEVELTGQREELMEVVIDTLKMESYSISQSELINALRMNNQLIPAGFIDGGAGRFNIKVPGLILGADDVYSLPVKQFGEGVVTLGDVATIKRTFKDPSTFTLVNGQPAISLDVIKRIGENIIENNAAVRATVEEVTKDLPSTISVSYMLDESDNIFQTLSSLESSIMTAIFLVMVVVIAALGLRSAILVGLAIPTSFMLGFLTLTSLGMTVNTMVMFGLVLTVGMLVDGAIVMVEYADRKAAEGMPPRDAYIRAAKLMFWPIVSSTATTLAAFLPMLMWPGVPGEFMSYLPIMVIIILSGSLLTAMVFLPVTGGILAYVFAMFGKYGEYILAGLTALILAVIASSLTPLVAILGALSKLVGLVVFFAAFFPALKLFRPILNYSRARAERRKTEEIAAAKVFSAAGRFEVSKLTGITRVYIGILEVLVRKWWAGVLTIVTMVIICGVILFSFMANNAGTQFFIDEEPESGRFYVTARGNMSANEALLLVQKVDAIILTEPGIQNVVTRAFPAGVRGGGGNNAPADLIGSIDIEFADFCCRLPAQDIFNSIRAKTSLLPGIKTESRKVEGGPPTGKDIQLQISSNDYDAAVAATTRIRDYLDTVEGLRDQEDSRPIPGIDWELTIDREKAARYKADIAAVGAMVQLVTNGVLIGDYRPSDSEDEVDIRVRLPKRERTLDKFEELRLQTPLGLVPLSNFMKRTPKQKVASITRRDGQFSLDVKAGVNQDDFLITEKEKEIKQWLDAQTWPDGVFYKFRGANEEQAKSQAFLMKALIGALFLMFIILLTQYNSFYQSFLTLSTVVMSVFGVLLGMIVTGQKFSIIMTGTGIVALAGIVVNNAIVLIDTYNRFREDGQDPIDAALRTSAQRVRPVMLTTITTIAGLIPMATQISFDFANQVTTFGSVTASWWVQLSTAVISGLAFSTLLTLIVIPISLVMPLHLSTLGRAIMHWWTMRNSNDQYAGASGLADLKEPMFEDNEPVDAIKKVSEAAE